MLADFVFKGIDSLFNMKLGLEPQKQKKNILTKDLIKKNLKTVIKKGGICENGQRQNNTRTSSPMNKSRLRSILEFNKQQRIRSVVKKNCLDRSTSPSGYIKIERTPSTHLLPSNSTSVLKTVASDISSSELKKQQNMIVYYRQQRKQKTIEKSRISSNENGYLSRKKQKIRDMTEQNEEIKEKDSNNKVKENIVRVPSYKRINGLRN